MVKDIIDNLLATIDDQEDGKGALAKLLDESLQKANGV